MTENTAEIEEFEGVEQPRKKSALEALMGATTDIQKPVYMKRLDSDFVIKALTGDKINELREQCTYSKPGKGGKMERVENTEELGQLIVAEACVEPDFSDEALMTHYKAISPGNCTQKALLAGEIVKLSAEIMDLSGFEDDPIEEVKNG